MPPTVDAVVLAAGASRRSRPAHKLIADLGGRPVIAWTLAAVAPHVRDLVVVTAGDPALEALLGDVRVVRNPHPERGMSSSLRVGLDALQPGADAVLQALGDMPFLRPSDVGALVAAARPDRVVLPVHAGEHGHPVVWGAAALPLIRALDPEATARDLLASGRLGIDEIPIDHDGVLFDVDTPEALEEARRRV